MYQQNIELTEKRINSLRVYFESELPKQKEKLVPQGYDLRTVQPHIGEKYDCLVNKNNLETPFRLLIMGLEALDEKGISMEQRSAQILTEAAYLKKSNPHMKGTTLLLQYIIHDLLGYPLTDEEYIGEKNLYNHIFNYFTLSNWHITGCFKEGTNKPNRPAQMNKIAVQNFIKQIDILEPSLVILQGKTISLEDFTKKYSDDEARWVGLQQDKRPNDLPKADNYMVYVPNDKNKFKTPVIKFVHPSDRGKKANPWYKPDAPYLNDIIKPVFKEVIVNYGKYIQPLD